MCAETGSFLLAFQVLAILSGIVTLARITRGAESQGEVDSNVHMCPH